MRSEQGDPLGPVYCAAALGFVMKRVRERLENNGISMIDVWFMDDGQIICDPADADMILRTIDDEAAKIGAVRGRGPNAKSVCRLIGSEIARSQVLADWRTEYIVCSTIEKPDNDLEGHVLGINFDDDDATTKQFIAASDVAQFARDKLSLIGECPSELAVMQPCLNTCKIVHLLRATGPFINENALIKHDEQLKLSLNSMLGCELPDHSVE